MSSPPLHPPPTQSAVLEALNKNSQTMTTQAIPVLERIIQDFNSTETQKTKALLSASGLLLQEGRETEIQDLMAKAWPFLSSVGDNVALDVIFTIMDGVSRSAGSNLLQAKLYRQMICYSGERKNKNLRHKLEHCLAHLFIDCQDYRAALNLLAYMDKDSINSSRLVSNYLLRTKLHLSTEPQEIQKAWRALTSAQEIAKSLQISEYEQAILHMQSGVFYAEIGDYSKACEYFLKACPNLDELKDNVHKHCLRYLALCRIMSKMEVSTDHFNNLYGSKEFEGMRAVADAQERGAMDLFLTALKNYKDELLKDPFVRKHLGLLHGTLLKDNLQKLIEPKSRVEITKFAELIDLPADNAKRFLSQMILAKKLAGSLDEAPGYLIIHDDPKSDPVAAIMSEMEKFVSTEVQRMKATTRH